MPLGKSFAFESATHAITFILSIATVIGVVSGALIAELKYEPYGIHFLEMADIDDYVRVAVKHVLLLLSFAITTLAFYRLYRKVKHKRHLHVPAIAFSAACFIGLFFTVPHYLSLFDVEHELHDQEDEMFFYSATYGFEEREVHCLRYITHTGEFIHFLSAQDKLVSLNKNKVSTLMAHNSCHEATRSAEH